MKINCCSMKEFLDVIEGLVQRGIQFNANTSSYTITLTGGF